MKTIPWRILAPFLSLAIVFGLFHLALGISASTRTDAPLVSHSRGAGYLRRPEGHRAGMARGPVAQPLSHADGTIDIGPVVRRKPLPLYTAGAARLSPQLTAQGGYRVGDRRVFVALDTVVLGGYFLANYEVRLISDTVEVWVQTDLRYRNRDGSLNSIHPEVQHPREITQERIAALAAAFQEVIRPTDVEYFGNYASRDGRNPLLPDLVPSLGLPPGYYAGPGQRVIILVSNIRDENYYDPASNPARIVGFYSPTVNLFADRNVITIDSSLWDQWVGPPRFQYDATIAHELQHLINADYDSDEDIWANEGRSELAEFLAGYRPTPESWRTQFSDFPENSLTIWGDQDGDPDQPGFEILADYHEASWFFLYLAGRLREAGIGTSNNQFLKHVAGLTMDPANGVASIDGMLASVGAPFRFREVWRDFRIAMLYGGTSDGTSWGDFISQYPAPSSVPVAPLDLGRLRRNLDFEGYDQPGAPPDGSDYIEIGWSPAITSGTTVNFDGDTTPPPTDWQVIAADSAGVPASGAIAQNVLYSGHADLTDNFLIFKATVPATGTPTLAFDTLYNIEAGWDFGFVQVTTDTIGATGFVSLPVSGTTTATDPSAHPVIKANVPGLSGVSGSEETPGWVHVAYDLSDYAGQEVLLAFRYSTDWAAAGQVDPPPAPGWYLDNITLGDVALYTDEPAVPAGAMSIWQARNEANRFLLNIVTFADRDGPAIRRVFTPTLDAAGDGTFNLGALLDEPGFDEAGERVVAVVSAVPPTRDPDLISVPSVYSPYRLTGLPPSVYTSRARVLGTATDSSVTRPRVYPGDNVTVTVTVDNLGRNVDLSAVPGEAYVAVPIPEHTQFVSGTLGVDVAPENITYTTNLQSLDSGLPARPGVYWHGTVTHTADLFFELNVVQPLAIDTAITPTAYIANGPFGANPSQRFTDLENAVQVESPLAFSTATAMGSVRIGSTAVFTYTLVNTDDEMRDVDFRFVAPHGTTLERLRVNLRELGAGAALAHDGGFNLNLSVPSFLETGLTTVVVIELKVTRDFQAPRLNPMAEVLQPGSDIPYATLQLDVPGGATRVVNALYLPLVVR